MIRVLFHPITILLALLCVQWVVLVEIGTFSVQVPYLGLLLLPVLAALSPRKLWAARLYCNRNGFWLAPMAVYLIITTLIFSGTAGQEIGPRQIFFLICGVALGAWIATTSRLADVFRAGAGLGLVILVMAIELLARSIEMSWLDAATQFFANGNLDYVFYKFLTTIFNSFDTTGDGSISASRKNDIALCVLLLALLYRSGSRRPQKDFAGMAVMAGSLALLVMLNDRSVLIAAGACLAMATVLGSLVAGQKAGPLLALKLLALSAALVFVAGTSVPDSPLSNMLGDRFSFDDRSTAGRLEGYEAALDEIEKNPIAGSGYFEVDGKAIHNAFLAAWAYTGILGFSLVVIVYIGILARWSVFVLTIRNMIGRWTLPVAVEWIAPLPFIPLFRVWLSGEGGIFKLGEWLAVSVFFGCLLANELQSRRISRARAEGPAPTPNTVVWSPAAR